MNTGAECSDAQGEHKMIKVALVALFVMSMGTLGLAASGLPVDPTTTAVELR